MAQGNNIEKVQGQDKFNYQDLKKIIDKTIANDKLSNDLFINNVMGGFSPFLTQHSQGSHFNMFQQAEQLVESNQQQHHSDSHKDSHHSHHKQHQEGHKESTGSHYDTHKGEAHPTHHHEH